MNEPTMLDYAFAALELGPVFPCAGKEPLTPNGFKDASTDPEQIRAWWTANPTANPAIAIPNGLAVIDFDPRGHSSAPRRCKRCGAQVALADSCGACGAPGSQLDKIYGLPAEVRDPILQQQLATFPDLPQTLVAETGDGGRHVWLKLDPELTLPKALGDGIDSRVGGKHYVMAAGSVHPITGKRYRWLAN